MRDQHPPFKANTADQFCFALIVFYRPADLRGVGVRLMARTNGSPRWSTLLTPWLDPTGVWRGAPCAPVRETGPR